MMATFQDDVLLTAFFLNNPTGTGRSNYIHSTYYVAHQTTKWCFDSSLPSSFPHMPMGLCMYVQYVFSRLYRTVSKVILSCSLVTASSCVFSPWSPGDSSSASQRVRLARQVGSQSRSSSACDLTRSERVWRNMWNA